MDEGAQNAMLRSSLVALAIACTAAVLLTRLELPIFFRFGLFVPFFLSSTWLFQAIGKT